MNNIVILTHGWTGSSVFAALFGEAGYWLGADTRRTLYYNTFENAELVSLNEALLRTLIPTLNHEHYFDAEDVIEIERRAHDQDLHTYRKFVDQCNNNDPWLWKDPRLTWTMRIWSRILDLKKTSFLVLTRDHTQAWISANRRRHVQSVQFTRNYNDGITRSNVRFLEEHGLPYMQASFEGLLLEPEGTLDRLNEFFGTQLTLDRLRAVCHEPLGRKSNGWKNLVEAALVYLKNYGERDGRAREQVNA